MGAHMSRLIDFYLRKLSLQVALTVGTRSRAHFSSDPNEIWSGVSQHHGQVLLKISIHMGAHTSRVTDFIFSSFFCILNNLDFFQC